MNMFLLNILLAVTWGMATGMFSVPNLTFGFALGYLTAVGVGVGLVTPYAGALAIPVVVYAACLAMMASLATGVGRGAGWGGVLFVLSDAVLALDHFVGWLDVPHVYFWNILTYATAQALLVRGVLRRARTSAPSTTVVSA